MLAPDVVVVGAGNAALTAALSAKEAGADRVLICEAADEKAMGGNSRFTFAGFRVGIENTQQMQHIIPGIDELELGYVRNNPYTPDDFYHHLMTLSGQKADPVLCRNLADQSAKVLKWMTGLGVEWDLSMSGFPPDPVWKRSPGSVFAKGRGKGLISSLLQAVHDKKIEIKYDTAFERLIVEEGQVTGAVFKSGNQEVIIKCKNIILACGSFEASKTMREKHMGQTWAQMKVRGTRFNTGKGLQAALDVGAVSYGNWAMGHGVPLMDDAEDYGVLELGETTRRCLFQYSITVNEQGQRFFDEGRTKKQHMYGETGAEVAGQSHQRAFQIFDAKITTAPAFEQLMYFSFQNHFVASSLEELADRIGVPIRAFVEEVQTYNESIDLSRAFNTRVLDGRGSKGLRVPRSNFGITLDTPPYYAFPVTGGVTFAFGGIKTNIKGQVLNTQDNPIRGLYAAGEMAGGYFVKSYPANAGLVRGAVTGYSAGQNLEL